MVRNTEAGMSMGREVYILAMGWNTTTSQGP